MNEGKSRVTSSINCVLDRKWKIPYKLEKVYHPYDIINAEESRLRVSGCEEREREREIHREREIERLRDT